MTGSYDHLQVALSVLIGIAASYAALELAGRVTAAKRTKRAAWLIADQHGRRHLVDALCRHAGVPIAYSDTLSLAHGAPIPPGGSLMLDLCLGSC